MNCVNKYSSSAHKSSELRRIEHSPSWEKDDGKTSAFYVYVMKLSNGSYHISNTRDLRKRISEHKDNQTQTTAGLKPKLVYYEKKRSIYDVSLQESILKDLAQSNERQFRKMITGFRDKMREESLV
jgi:predicted GIY-YIG superfamily endonuclease